MLDDALFNELLAGFKTHINEDSGINDAVLKTQLNAAIALVSNKINFDFGKRRIISEVLEVYNGGVKLSFIPVDNIFEIQNNKFKLDLGVFGRTTPIYRNGCQVMVKYTTGYKCLAEIPFAIRHAIFLIAAYLYENRGDGMMARATPAALRFKEASDPILRSGAHSFLSEYRVIAY